MARKIISFPKRYIPAFLTKSDAQKQIRNLLKTRKNYMKGIYKDRPKLKPAFTQGYQVFAGRI